jgi:hypothetical protein
VADAAGQPAREHGRRGADVDAARPVAGAVVRRHVDGRQARAAVGHGFGVAAHQQGVGQRGGFGGQLLEHGAHLDERLGMRGVGAQGVQVELAGQQLVAHLEHDHQHGRQPLAARRARRLQHDVARGLQLVGQRGLLAQQLAEQGRGRVAHVARFVLRQELAGLGAHQRGQRIQNVGHRLRAKAPVEHQVGQRGPHHVEARAQAEVPGALQRIGHAAGAGVAMEKIIENITAMAMGMPRLPQAISKKAMKVAGTSSSPSRMGAVCSICTAKNSGSPMSGAGSICRNLPRRGPGRSGGAVTITPVAAAEAAMVPSQKWMPPEMNSSPSATVSPLAT